jgi:enoyl-CoA hydratase
LTGCARGTYTRLIHGTQAEHPKMNDTTAQASEEILFAVRGRLGQITMNRPKALNALTHDMSLRLDMQLRRWEAEPRVETVVITGTGDKAFCAGGDVRALCAAGPKGSLTRDFYWNEYRMNRRIFRYPKPYVALMDGITMGGGVGVSAPGRLRVATEKTLLAMPETGIGLFPDVGASYYLSHLPGQLGTYLGLTGARVKAADLLYTGLATHFIPSSLMPAVIVALEREPAADVIRRFAARPDGAAPLAALRTAIDRCFAGDTVEDILAALEREGGAWAQETRTGLLQKSPFSLRVTLRELREAAALDFDACMRMEYRLVRHFMGDHDFFEGVRAVLVDKDNQPRWQPPTLAEVTPAMVDAYFAPLAGDELHYDDK